MSEEPAERRTSINPKLAIVMVVALIAALAWGLSNSKSGDPGSSGTAESAPGSGTDTASTGVSPAPRAPGSPGAPPVTTSQSTPRPPGSTTAPGATGQTTSPAIRPAAPGELLESTSRPPSGTLAMVEPATLPADARYMIVFRPYGYGPDTGGAQTLVLLVEESQPANDSAKKFDFTGRNVLATLVTPDAEVTVGGTYEGVLSLRARSGLLAPVIENIRAR